MGFLLTQYLRDPVKDPPRRILGHFVGHLWKKYTCYKRKYTTALSRNARISLKRSALQFDISVRNAHAQRGAEIWKFWIFLKFCCFLHWTFFNESSRFKNYVWPLDWGFICDKKSKMLPNDTLKNEIGQFLTSEIYQIPDVAGPCYYTLTNKN